MSKISDGFKTNVVMTKALALVFACMFLITATATRVFAIPKTNRVSVTYVLPKNPEHQLIYERLKDRQMLERLRTFLSPFRLPRVLKVSLQGCEGEADAFYGDDLITICYEYVNELWKNMPEKTTASGVEPMDALIGPLYDTTLHEFAHAIFDMLEIPVLGREEDAADQVAAFIYLQFGRAEASRLIKGTAYAYVSEAKRAAPLSLEHFADEHGPPAQRAYNVLCIAYGSDPKAYGDFVSKGFLPQKRAEACGDEYDQISDAFEELILPHINRAMARKVMGGFGVPRKAKP